MKSDDELLAVPNGGAFDWSVKASTWLVYPALRPDADRRIEIFISGMFTPEQARALARKIVSFADQEPCEPPDTGT